MAGESASGLFLEIWIHKRYKYITQLARQEGLGSLSLRDIFGLMAVSNTSIKIFEVSARPYF